MITDLRIRPTISALALLMLGAVTLLPARLAIAACTAANPNANISESTPTSAFTDHGDGTVTHKLTGLMWKRCVEGLSGASCSAGTATALTWKAALAASVADRTGGRSDWRLPNKLELQSIVEYCGSGPAINRLIFPATPSQIVMSGTPSPYGNATGGISFSDGLPYYLTVGFPFHARLVRGGRSFDSFDGQPLSLAVTRIGTGSGAVSSNVPGISCGTACTGYFSMNTSVTLTATPAVGSIFAGWLGACAGAGQCNVTIKGASAVSATFAPAGSVLNADIDGNRKVDASTDGLLALRYMFGLTGSSLTTGAIGDLATRTTPLDIIQHIDSIKPVFDVDGNGTTDALSDGLLLVRYLFGLRGTALIDGVVGPGATRKTSSQIETYLLSITQ